MRQKNAARRQRGGGYAAGRLIAALLIASLSLAPVAAAAAPPLQALETATPGLEDASPDETPSPEAGSEQAPPEAAATLGPAAATATEAAPESLQSTETPTPAAPTATPLPEQTGIPAATGTVPPSEAALAPLLDFTFTVAPAQAAPGDSVTFTATIANVGPSPATEVAFTNTVPAELAPARGSFPGLVFDPNTRLMRGEGTGVTLAPGEALRLEYTAQVAAGAAEGRIRDGAVVTAAGLTAPLAAEAELTVADADGRLGSAGQAGGQVAGPEGRVTIQIPPGALAAPGTIAVRDRRGAFPAPPGEIWTAFALERFEEARTQSATAAAGEHDERIQLIPVDAAFDQPVELTVSYDGLADLSTLGAEFEPFLATLDDASGTWVRVPLSDVDRRANTVTAAISHFSTWGAGVGPSFPQNGAGILLFDSAQPDLFTGRSRFSLPIWTPPGRNGMAPNLALSYSSGMADGVLGDVQAPWTGMGWSIDTVEIARQITNGVCSPCGSGAYGYKNKFILLFNGAGGELIPDGATPGRYHTRDESFLYIQLHNTQLNNGPSTANTTGEWWEVVARDGTRWRLGYTADAEQRAAMKGYPGAATGGWASLGYAGHATDRVAARWRADRVTDTHGNTITFSYFEETRTVAGTSHSYDRASYLDTVAYTGHTSGTPAAAYSVVFVRQNRSGEVPNPIFDWDFWDTYWLDKLEVRHGASVVRTYDLSFQVRNYSDDGTSWKTTVLTSVAVSGGSDSLPTVLFTYADLDNRADTTAGPEWAYPRLASIANGWGGTASFAYEHDGRPNTAWHNWRVTRLTIADGLGGSVPLRTDYAYFDPCYRDHNDTTCNTNDDSDLVGYARTDAAALDASEAVWARTLHKFHTDLQKVGREFETQSLDANGTILAKTLTTYTVVTDTLPATGFFTFASAAETFVRENFALRRMTRQEYEYDPATGNLIGLKEYDGVPATAALYRQTEYEYATNTNPSVWILDRLKRGVLKNAGGTILSEGRYAYDGTAAGIGAAGDLTLAQVISGTVSVDSALLYDAYGNVTEARAYEAYGTPGSLPSGAYRAGTVAYDTLLHTYPITATNPLNHTAIAAYDFARGLPTSITDANGNTTHTAYDGLGRVIAIAYPGYSLQDPNIELTYPAPVTGTVSAPFALQMQVLDEAPNPDVYRSTWSIFDGLGRVLQAQGPDLAGTGLIVVDRSYNAMGLPEYSGMPRAIGGSGGTYSAPSWWLVPHATTNYDALGRVSSVQAPDGGVVSASYDGLRATFFDRSNHKRVERTDAFGRLIQVEEYTGTGPHALYATTTYEYDPRGLLTTLTDAQGNQTSIAYNLLGQKVALDDPDMGLWQYEYDPLGNLVRQIDARGTALWFGYDALNRLTEKRETDSSGSVLATFAYDQGANGKGRRTGMSDASGSASWTYNALGQVSSETHTVGGTPYTISGAYDAFGRPFTQTYPDGETLAYSYNALGMLEQVSTSLGGNYVADVDYNLNGQVTSIVLGNGVTTTHTYNSLTTRLASTLAAKIPENPALSLAYTYDAGGNITRIIDGTRNETLTYEYDSLNRLTAARAARTTDSAVVHYERTYSYDTIGNILTVGHWPKTPDPNNNSASVGSAALAENGSRNRISAFVGAAYTDSTNQGGSVSAFTVGRLGPSLPSDLIAGRGSVASGAISANGSRGSLTSFVGGGAVLAFTKSATGYLPPASGPDPGWAYTTYTYGDAAHKHAVTALSTGETYQYDANGNMIQRVEGGQTYTQVFNSENRLASVTVDGQTTTFLYDGNGDLVKKVRPDGTATVYVGGIYEVELSAGGAETQTTKYYPAGAVRVAGTVYYVLGDHLGSASVATDASGDVVAGTEQRYYPFGEARLAGGGMPTDRLFTGQREIADLGIYHFGARFYSPTLGRFLSADPIVSNPTNPQALNRYSYVYNNPLRYTDPTGNLPCGYDNGEPYGSGCAGKDNRSLAAGASGGGKARGYFGSDGGGSVAGGGGGSGGSSAGNAPSGMAAHWGWVPGDAGGWQPGWVYYSAGSSPGGNGGGKSKARAPTIQDYCRGHAHTCGNANQPVGGGGAGASESPVGRGQTPSAQQLAQTLLSGAALMHSGRESGKPPGLASPPSALNPEPILPPSPFACDWLDCGLSGIGLLATAFTIYPNERVVAGAIIVDVVATSISIGRTEQDFAEGEIGEARRWSLHGSAVIGLYPGTFPGGGIGMGASLANFIFTMTGWPP